MIAIAAVDRNWGIGKNGSLLIRIPEDQKYFRRTTEGKVVVMGRKTLESFPGGKPLKNRTNIVLSSNPHYRSEGTVVCHDLAQLQRVLLPYASDDIFVIGGGAVYAQLLPFCEKALITRIDRVFPSDTFFPDLDQKECWALKEAGEIYRFEEIEYRFTTYVNQAPALLPNS